MALVLSIWINGFPDLKAWNISSLTDFVNCCKLEQPLLSPK